MDKELPRLHGDGVTDDSAALQTLIDGGKVIWRDEILQNGDVKLDLSGITFFISKSLVVGDGRPFDLPFKNARISG